MSKKNIVGLDPNFIPYITPIVNGMGAIKMIKEFPVMVRPAKEGVPIVIRSGYMHTLEYPFRIMNVNLKDKFYPFINHLKDNKKLNGIPTIVHATLHSPTTSTKELKKLIHKGKKKMPSDLELIITDYTFTNSDPLKSTFATRYQLLRGTFGEGQLPFMPNVKIANYSTVESPGKLENLIEHVVLNEVGNKGVFIAYPGGHYASGQLPVAESPTMVISPTQELTGRIVNVVNGATQISGKVVPTAEKIIISYNDEELECLVTNEPAKVREYLCANAPSLVGRKVSFEALNLTNYNIPKAAKLIRIW